MGIRLRGGSWQVDVSHQGRRLTGTRPSKGEAIALEAALRAQLLNDITEDSTSATVKLEAWTLEDAIKRTSTIRWAGSPRSKQSTSRLGTLRRQFGDKTPVTSITTDSIDEWIGQMQQAGMRPASINRYLSVLSAILRVAEERGRLPGGLPRVTYQKVLKDRIRWLSAEEEAELLGTLDSLGCTLMSKFVVVLLETGMRKGEALNLSPQHIREDGTAEVFAPKTRSMRRVPLTKRAKAVLDELGADKGQSYFASHGLTVPKVTFQWAKARREMGLEDDRHFVPHVCRHTFASRLVQRGAPIQVVKELLGHTDISMTMRYAHLAPSNLASAISLLE